MAVVAADSVSGMLAWGAIYRRADDGTVFGAAAVIALSASLVATCWVRRALFAPTELRLKPSHRGRGGLGADGGRDRGGDAA